MISIWFRFRDNAPTVLDRAPDRARANYLAHEYAMALGCLPGQAGYGRDRVWAGRRDQEPRG
jgi:hypothetical protein